jgi:hypothetical protein
MGEGEQRGLIRDLTTVLEKRNMRITELEDALRVFAAVADQYDNAHRYRAARFKEEGSVLPPPKDHEYVNLVTLGDCRRAKAALFCRTHGQVTK